MSSPYDSSRRRRGVWSHWVPLAVTITVATVGLAAWAWSQRKDEDESSDQYDDLDYDNTNHGGNVPRDATSRAALDPSSNPVGDATDQPRDAAQEGSWGARMSGALRRTPSPQQLLENAGKTVSASMAAAGAAAGRALAAIREEDKTAFADHEAWSEETSARRDRPSGSPPQETGKRRRTVAIVVSADVNTDSHDDDDFLEHAVSYST